MSLRHALSFLTKRRFAIPFVFSTTLGLAAVAFSAVPAANSSSQDPLSSNFIPLLAPLSDSAISAGLPASLAAATLLGQSGAAALLIVLFLAVTSATSAELIAVSSILTYDVYVVCSYLAFSAKSLTVNYRDILIQRLRNNRFCV